MNQHNPKPLGTVWPHTAKLQRIGQDFKWETLAQCLDTPNAIKDAAAQLVQDGVDINTLWVKGPATGRKMFKDLTL